MDLTSASAIVTGGASGLGRATAQTLHDAGAAVVVVDLPDTDESTAEGGARADSVAAIGGRAHFCPGDVTDPETAARAVATAQEHAPLRILVNCAGVATPGRLVGRGGPLPVETFMKVLAINVGGTMNFMAQAAAAMRENELDGEDRGVLINTASVAAFDGQIGQVAYAASKGAVASMTLPVARELASSQVRTVTIAPGLFETPMMAGLPEAAREALATKTPHPARLGRPEDYALLVRQILENPMLNGEVIRLDGAVRLEPR
ncbi:SDR family NAD(P)-dependent oxidoreductase [Nesterenkonia sp. HG001]|uniref:SDR family NAD(P)-dependent oxidoreductase n=1 Tax=Nesterenkonia sp. HG001 TaxID=2983207 RepID=UPI002AC6925B|nr:SDR family NAD(P)-dependent oxidoreductase [Nesterenkonia sp. HG001]MDZ5077748.1 SDR family NAD(P)-dependent oxidoreductase [Nesterenkonia sp. HG001]